MKRTLLLVMTALLTIVASAEEVVINQVHFPDRNFREWLLQQPYGADGVITDAEINAITSLSVQSLGIKSLKGIGYFTALTELYCYGNQLDGNAMLQLSGELPSSVGETTFNLYAIDGKDSSEGNVLTTSIAYLLNDKGWKVYDRNGGEAVEIVGALPDKSTWLTLDDWATKSQRMPLDTTYTDATGTLKVKVNNQENKMKWDIDKRFWFENPLGIAELWEGTRLNTNTKVTTTNMVVTTPTAGYLYVYAYTGVPGRTLSAMGKSNGMYIKQVELPNSKVDMQDADGTMRGSYPNTCIPVSVENAAAGVELTSPYGSIYICSIIFVPIGFESSLTPMTSIFTTEEGTKLTLQVISEDEKTAIITAADVATGQTELTIPQTANGYSITGIGDNVFSNYSLERVSLPETIEEIGEWAFSGCAKLTEINLPAALKSIGNSAFCNSHELTSFNIPQNLFYIGDNCFSNCTQLASFTVDAANTHFTVQDGILYGTENGVPTTLVMYPMPKNDVTDFVVPSTVKKIQTLKNITSLETITLPDGIEKIVDMGWGCRSLKAIYLHPDNPYYTTQDGVLYDKSMQTLMLIPEGHQMETFTVPYGVTRIESGAIAYLQQLKVLNISAWVRSINRTDFHNYPCPALQAINVDEYNTGYSSIDGLLYEKRNDQPYYLYCCPPARMGDVTIPDTGIRIYGAFRNCQKLGTVEIPASAICSSRLVVNGNYYLGIFNNTKIEKLVIYSDDILNYDIYPERAAQILDLSTVIYVPENRVEACKASAGWGQYTIKSIDELTTGINAIESGPVSKDNDAPSYNLNGQRVGENYKGLVIKNGRKVIVK